jgi:hypothetical protein
MFPITVIWNTIFLLLSGKEVPIHTEIINVPDELFGNNHNIPPIYCEYMDVLSVVSNKLLDNAVVGNNLEHFSFNGNYDTTLAGERCISNPNTGTLFYFTFI